MISTAECAYCKQKNPVVFWSFVLLNVGQTIAKKNNDEELDEGCKAQYSTALRPSLRDTRVEIAQATKSDPLFKLNGKRRAKGVQDHGWTAGTV